MTNLPLVSVAMCTYNGEQYLDEQISSIFAQDYNNIELIIIDDCSTDDTWEMLQKWKKIHTDQVTIHKNDTNVGYNKNFEKAISLTKGDYIAITDQDDIWLPNKISRLLACFIRGNVSLAHGAEGVIIHKNLKVGSDSRIDKILFKGSDIRTILLHNQIPGHCMMFTSKIIKDIIPIPDNMFYDWWILAIATCHGKIEVADDILMYHRIHSNNAYFKLNERYKDEHGLTVLKSLYIFKTIKGLDRKSIRFIDNTICILERHFKLYRGKFDIYLFIYLLYWKKIVFPIFNRRSYLRRQAAILKAAYIYSKW